MVVKTVIHQVTIIKINIFALHEVNLEAHDEWGEFLHLPNKKFYDFNEIRDEIIADTDAKTGGSHAKGSTHSSL